MWIISHDDLEWASSVRDTLRGEEFLTAFSFHVQDALTMRGRDIVKMCWSQLNAGTTKISGQTGITGYGHIGPTLPMSISQLVALDFPPPAWLIRDLVAKGDLVVLGGRPKVGKTWLCLEVAKSVDTGKPFLGRKITTAKVIYIALEDGQRRIRQRILQLGWQPQSASILFSLPTFDGQPGKPGPGIAEIAKLALDYDLIIIDTLVATRSGRVKERSNAPMGVIMNQLARIAHETDTTIFLVHHAGKAVYEDPFKNLRGASSLRGGYDVGFMLVRPHGIREATLHAESRDYEIKAVTLRQAVNGEGWEYVETAQRNPKIRAGAAVYKVMVENDPDDLGMTAAQIANIKSFSVSNAHNQLKKLEENRYVYRVKGSSTANGRLPDAWHVASLNEYP